MSGMWNCVHVSNLAISLHNKGCAIVSGLLRDFLQWTMSNPNELDTTFILKPLYIRFMGSSSLSHKCISLPYCYVLHDSFCELHLPQYGATAIM